MPVTRARKTKTQKAIESLEDDWALPLGQEVLNDEIDRILREADEQNEEIDSPLEQSNLQMEARHQLETQNAVREGESVYQDAESEASSEFVPDEESESPQKGRSPLEDLQGLDCQEDGDGLWGFENDDDAPDADNNEEDFDPNGNGEYSKLADETSELDDMMQTPIPTREPGRKAPGEMNLVESEDSDNNIIATKEAGRGRRTQTTHKRRVPDTLSSTEESSDNATQSRRRRKETDKRRNLGKGEARALSSDSEGRNTAMLRLW